MKNKSAPMHGASGIFVNIAMAQVKLNGVAHDTHRRIKGKEGERMKITVTKHVCDLCEADNSEWMSRISHRIGFWVCGYMAEKEICKKCRESFDAWLVSRSKGVTTHENP